MEQIRELVGEIRLAPTAKSYLKAVLAGPYEGVLKLAVGTKLNNLFAGACNHRPRSILTSA